MRLYKDQGVNYHQLDAVNDEDLRQIQKWGRQERTLFEWGNYLTEEVGEVAKAIAELEYREGTTNELYRECIQVATLALKIARMVA